VLIVGNSSDLPQTTSRTGTLTASFSTQYLPLTYNQFEKAIQQTFNEFGGREVLENSKDVKGAKVVSGLEPAYDWCREIYIVLLQVSKLCTED
jgi:hypothetical protein